MTRENKIQKEKIKHQICGTLQGGYWNNMSNRRWVVFLREMVIFLQGVKENKTPSVQH